MLTDGRTTGAGAAASLPRAPAQPSVEELYRTHAPMVLRRARQFLGATEAEEVLHDVFVKVIENLHVFTAEQSPAAWLYKVATNLCLNRVRLGGRRRELLVERGDDLWHPLKEVAGQEAALLLRELWRELPDELLAIAVYYYVDGMAQAEIAELLGVSRRTVGNRIAELTLRAQKSGATRPGAELEV